MAPVPESKRLGGVYKEVPRKTELINTYNPNDKVITLRDVEGLQAWLAVQQNQKPYIGPLGLLHDNRCTLFWAPLVDQDAAQQDDLWSLAPKSIFRVNDKALDIGRLTRNWGGARLLVRNALGHGGGPGVAVGAIPGHRATEVLRGSGPHPPLLPVP